MTVLYPNLCYEEVCYVPTKTLTDIFVYVAPQKIHV